MGFHNHRVVVVAAHNAFPVLVVVERSTLLEVGRYYNSLVEDRSLLVVGALVTGRRCKGQGRR